MATMIKSLLFTAPEPARAPMRHHTCADRQAHGLPAGRRHGRPDHRLNRGGDRQATSTLHRIALVRMRHDPRTCVRVERRTKENTSEILRCLERAIARGIHHVLLAPSAEAPIDLRALRSQKGITLPQAAEALQTRPARISVIERRARPLPDLTDRSRT